MAIATVERISTIETWRQYIQVHWETLNSQAQAFGFKSSYIILVAVALTPVLPQDSASLNILVKILKSQSESKGLVEHFKKIYSNNDFNLSPKTLVEEHFDIQKLSVEEQNSLDWLLVETGVLVSAAQRENHPKTLAESLLLDLKEKQIQAPRLSIQADMISAGHNVVFANRDVNIVTQYYQGNQAALKSYLASVRSVWNTPELSHILPGSNRETTNAVRLHQLYTPIDVWKDVDFSDKEFEQLSELRFRALEHDLTDSRLPVLEAIASSPRIVITGGPGTGKSSLCRFLATCLAYACDPEMEKTDNIRGLDLLGISWIHGAILPLYVNLRAFSSNEHFPQKMEDASAQSLLDYLCQKTRSFGKDLERYLTNTEVKSDGAILLLDGLDEVYHEQNRLILQNIIENWAERFDKCRILVTSRTYAYRHDSRWRLAKFETEELAPYTWKQMHHYIENWYSQAALLRPALYGGLEVAETQTTNQANDLMRTIVSSPALLPLARQPLMLALLTLIHDDHRKLPDKQAALYEKTVELLDHWNVSSSNDHLAEKLSNLNLEAMRAALKLTAFDLQKQRVQHERFPASIHRKELLEKLMQQQTQGDGLGASIEDVLEYLATRNGILVSDKNGLYRFPHLSIQEYLAACALIELYDECEMPHDFDKSEVQNRVFPGNLACLLKRDPYRWRNVAMFAGSIIAIGKGQDRRWELIEALLPSQLETPLPEETLHSIYIASQVWAETWLKARTRSQNAIQDHLLSCLEAIQDDDRLDAPERSKLLANIKRLQASKA